MKTKLIFLIGDGMGDRPVDELDGKTPLEAAETPAMDALARDCCAGVARTIPDSMPPGSDVANMSLIGFDPAVHHTGRGPIEAAAMGLDLGPDDLIYRLNLVVVDDFGPDGTMRDYSGGHITTEQSHEVIELFRNAVEAEGFEFFPGVSYRHILVQRGGATRPEAGVEIRPPHDITDKPVREDYETLEGNPALLNVMRECSRLLAERMPELAPNAVWPWGQGRPLMLPDFEKAYGMKGAVISAVDLVRGLGRACGMEVIDVPGVTGLLDTNYEGKVAAALDFLERGDFAYLHVEAPDECGHSGITADKVEAIRRFDSRVVAPVAKALEGRDTAVLVTCDHFTPLAERTHTKDPVPFMLSVPDCRGKLMHGFTEKTAANTGTLVDPGHELMRWVLGRFGS
jgi:2,3-bisphosphoglycerate-independent phosphoglycerate mutase